jgi:serine/threonine-protein kinase
VSKTLQEERAGTPAGAALNALLGASLGDRYRIDRELGRGGMGRVFAARDLKLGRDVALKVLSAREDQNVRRFEQEARAAGALNHPNIVAVHDIGNHAGWQYIVSELLDGATLRTALAVGAIPLRKAVDYARQLARGLCAAHEKGIVHRDLKPENLFVTAGGVLKILDFGIAKLLASDRRAAVPDDSAPPILTETGAILGTVEYMSPEQVRGRDVDHRSDIFSFGTIVHEMLTGRRPFQRATSVETGYAILHQEPEPLPPEVPAGLRHIVKRCLAKDPQERFQSGHELLLRLDEIAEDTGAMAAGRSRWLRRAGMAGAFALAVAGGVATAFVFAPALQGWLSQPRGSRAAVPARRLAVLPFREVGGARGGEAFSAGLAEILTNNLRQLEQFQASLRVVSASAVLKEGIAGPRDAGRAFGATLALSGSVRSSPDKLMVTAELVDTKTLLVVAARDVEVPREKISALQGLLLQRVSEMLQLELRPEARRALEQGLTPVPGAYEFYLQGRGYLQRYDRVENLDSALAVFQKALAQDPAYALAHAGQAEAFLRRYKQTRDAQLLDLARDSARRAVELDDQLLPVHLTMGLIHAAAGEHQQAIESFEKALKLESENADAVRELANAYDAAGRPQDAEATFRRAIELRPDSWAAYNALGVFYNQHGRFTEAVPWFRRVIDLTPDNYFAYANLGAMYLRLGRHAEAAAMLERSLALNPSSQSYSNLGTVYYFQEKYRQAAEMYLKAVELSPADDRTWGNLADAYRWIAGKSEESARAFRQAAAQAEKQVAASPRDADLRSRLAMYRISVGEAEAARAQIAQAVRLAPDNGQVMYRAALVYEQSGMRGRALEALGAALQAGFSREEIDKAPPLTALRQDAGYRKLIERFRK